MAIAASDPVLPNQKKQCCKTARFTDAPCIWQFLKTRIGQISGSFNTAQGRTMGWARRAAARVANL